MIYYNLVALSLILTLFMGGKSYGSVINGSLDGEVLYYIIVDRFHDGNEKNNIPDWAFPVVENSEGLTSDELQQNQKNRWSKFWLDKIYDKSKRNIQHYQGGDLEGVIKKLDYLNDLGITSIMISPIFDNVEGVFYHNGNTSYHGYWTKDWFRLDEHFANPPQKSESLEEALGGKHLLKRLVDKAHGLGIKVLLDLSLNHTSPALLMEKYNKKKITYYNLEFSPIYKNGKLLKKYCYPTFSTMCGDSLDSSGWFNSATPIDDWDDPYQLQNNQIHSLADLNQSNPELKKYLFDAVFSWLDVGLDGFRIDAIKHLYPEFLDELEEKLIEKKNDLILIGEYFDGGIGNGQSVDWMTSTAHYTMFDFTLAHWMRDFFGGTTDYYKRNTPGWVENITDPNLMDGRSNSLITFINNHDLSRMVSNPNISYDQYLAAMKFLMVTRGVPKLTYGDEIGLGISYNQIPPKDRANNPITAAADPWCRTMMEWDWKKNSESQKRFEITKKLIELRKNSSALIRGATKYIKLSSWNIKNLFGHNSMAVERYDNKTGTGVYFFYSRIDQSLSGKVRLADGVYHDYIDRNLSYKVKDGVIHLNDLTKNQVILIKF